MVKRIKSFDAEFYARISIPDLILFSIYQAEGRQEKCTFDRLVKECFVLFPNCFSFPLFPQWPDSRKLDRPLRTLRKTKLIFGDPKTFFALTKTGAKRAEEVSKIFRQRKLFK